VRGSLGFGNELLFSFLFVYNCMLWAILCFCFGYISIWHCVSNQRLVPCNQPEHSDTPRHSNLGWKQQVIKAATTSSHGGPTSPHRNAPGPHRVVCSTSHATRKPNRMCPIQHSTRSHKSSSGLDGHQRMGTYLLTGSGVCCALIPSVFSSPPPYRCEFLER
jgi:hypothetical protein